MKRRITGKTNLSSVTTISFLIFFALTAAAAELHVPGDYPTIQAGIDAAANGDTVLIAGGMYTGAGNKDLEFKGKAITVQSESGAASCIIDCQGSGRGVYFNGSEGPASILDGLTIKNGYVTGGYLTNRGGGIRIGTNATPTIRNCIIENNYAKGMGSGVYVGSNSVTFDNCTFLGNQGEGLYHDGYYDTLILQNCTFEANTGGGVYGADLEMTGCMVRNNGNTGVFGSGIIDTCTFIGNTGLNGGALHLGSGSITNCSFVDNYAAETGGAIYCSTASETVIGGTSGAGNVFSGNRAGAGADIFCYPFQPGLVNAGYNDFNGYCLSDYYVSPQELFDLEGCSSGQTPVYQDVYVAADGDDANDGLSWDNPFQTLQRAASAVVGTVEHPVTIHVENGVYSPSQTGEIFPVAMLDFVRIQGEDPDFTILDAEQTSPVFFAAFDDYCSVSGIHATNGMNGLRALQSSPLFQNCRITAGAGSGVDSRQGSLDMVDTEVSTHGLNGFSIYGTRVNLTNCAVEDNGRHGIYGSGCDLFLSGCSIRQNHAVDDGGGMSLSESTAELAGCRIMDNTADASGGGIHCTRETTLILNNCIIANNTAGDDGGGLYCVFDSIITMAHSTITGNTSVRSGGGISLVFDCIFTATDCILWGDEPSEIREFESPDMTITFCDIQGGQAGTGNIDADPRFISGPMGNYYLSQIEAGQGWDSPCINAGSIPATDACFQMAHGSICMDSMTTRTDQVTDDGTVNIGAHYFTDTYATPTPVPTEIPTATPTFTPT
ncbi:MAG TPA: right-handed parallel beta-helix repeat-containing protein, partial [bacterium]|nr:right-handed parallel beta-helix repeat-containing protein [bacterium]